VHELGVHFRTIASPLESLASVVALMHEFAHCYIAAIKDCAAEAGLSLPAERLSEFFEAFRKGALDEALANSGVAAFDLTGVTGESWDAFDLEFAVHGCEDISTIGELMTKTLAEIEDFSEPSQMEARVEPLIRLLNSTGEDVIQVLYEDLVDADPLARLVSAIRRRSSFEDFPFTMSTCRFGLD
jgi:hypothetical protein